MKTNKKQLPKNVITLNHQPVWKTRLWQCLLPSLIGVFCLGMPVEARTLESWRFQQNENQLSFSTDIEVQPKAKLIANPTRLVIDLPGISIGQIPRSLRSQYIGGSIKEIRVGQFEANIGRIVVELAEGYTLDPAQIKFEPLSPRDWTVQLPEPQAMETVLSPSASSPEETNIPSTVASRSDSRITSTVVEDIQVGRQGIVLKTSGRSPEFEVNQTQDGSRITIDLADTSIAEGVSGLNQVVKRLGVERLQVVEFPNNSLVRVTLDLTNNQQQWNASVSDSGGLLLWPDGGVTPEVAEASGFATIESIDLINNGTELVIKSDRPVSYDGGWDRATLDYAIQIFSAQMAEGVSLPSGFEVNNPILSVQERIDEPETVTLLVQPNPNFDITGIVQQGPNQIALQLQPKARVSANPRPIQVPPRPTTPAPPQNYPAVSNPSVRDGRMVIIIDPGHGGRDPGAVGLGGLRETDVVLDISHQVTQLLEQSGIQVVMTRQDEREVDLAPRTQLANRVNADLFVSIHANAVGGGRTGVNGVETYYYQSGNLLAQYIQNSILQSFNMNNRGVKQARFYVLRHTRMPAVLVEVGFVTGSYDSQILADPTQRTRMAEAIARGILQYVQRTR